MTDKADVRTGESDDDNPEAPDGIRNPIRPDDDGDQVEGHATRWGGLKDEGEGRGNPASSDDENEDTEGHGSRYTG